MAEHFTLTGFRELDAALNELGRLPARRFARRALRAAGDPILAKYKAGTKVYTGHLAASETMGTRLNRRQRKTTPRPKKSEVVVHIGTADPAGIMEEFGIHQAANPALTQAWDAEGGETGIERMGKSLGPDIEREAARLGRKARRDG